MDFEPVYFKLKKTNNTVTIVRMRDGPSAIKKLYV